MKPRSSFQFPVSSFRSAWPKPFVRLAIGALLAASLLSGPAAADEPAVELVRLKMTELGTMHSVLGNKAAQAVTIRGALEQQKSELAAEIRDRAATRGLRSLAEAQADARIAANFRLIGQAEAYAGQLFTKLQRFEANREKLADLMRRVDDDLMMLGQIKGLAVDHGAGLPGPRAGG